MKRHFSLILYSAKNLTSSWTFFVFFDFALLVFFLLLLGEVLPFGSSHLHQVLGWDTILLLFELLDALLDKLVVCRRGSLCLGFDQVLFRSSLGGLLLLFLCLVGSSVSLVYFIKGILELFKSILFLSVNLVDEVVDDLSCRHRLEGLRGE